MKKSIQKLMSLFPAIPFADHISSDWDAGNYHLDDEQFSPGMNSYPALLVDSSENVALAEWNWVSMPSWTQANSHAYMLSTRRI